MKAEVAFDIFVGSYPLYCFYCFKNSHFIIFMYSELKSIVSVPSTMCEQLCRTCLSFSISYA